MYQCYWWSTWHIINIVSPQILYLCMCLLWNYIPKGRSKTLMVNLVLWQYRCQTRWLAPRHTSCWHFGKTKLYSGQHLGKNWLVANVLSLSQLINQSKTQLYSSIRGYRDGSPTAVRPSDPALCGSCPLVTPYYCRLGDLLCLFCVYRFVCALLSTYICI